MSYRHTQMGWVSIASLVLGATAITGVCLWESFSPKILFAYVMLGLVGSQMYRMTVSVENGKLIILSGTGHLRKVIDLSEVASCEPVQNKWWFGWGLRWIPGGWLINVSGWDAVELRYRSGGLLRVGTDEPWQLCDAVQAELEANL